MHHRAPLPFLRACLVTAATVGLATGAHAFAGGHLPRLPVLALLAVLTLAPVMCLSRYRLRLPAMAGILGASQAGLHYAFTVLADTTGHCASPGGGIAAHGHHQVFALPDCTGSAAGLTAGHHHELTGWPGAVMLAAHILATAATALLLARGEDALWCIVAWLQPLARILAPAVFPVQAKLPVLRAAAVLVPRPGRLVPALRGPPSLAVS